MPRCSTRQCLDLFGKGAANRESNLSILAASVESQDVLTRGIPGTRHSYLRALSHLAPLRRCGPTGGCGSCGKFAAPGQRPLTKFAHLCAPARRCWIESSPAGTKGTRGCSSLQIRLLLDARHLDGQRPRFVERN